MTAHPPRALQAAVLGIAAVVVGCADAPARDDVLTSTFSRGETMYWLPDMTEWADQVDERRLESVEDSLTAAVLSRFTGDEREVMRTYLAGEGSGSLAGVQGDSVAADLFSKIDAIRTRIRNANLPPLLPDFVSVPEDVTGGQASAAVTLFGNGLIPIGVTIAEEGTTDAPATVVLRRVSEMPHDVLVLDSTPTIDELKNALAAVMNLHGNVGACPSSDGLLRIRGRPSLPPGTKWGAREEALAARTIESLTGGPRVDLPHVGRVRMRTIWVRRFYNAQLEGPPRPATTASVCGG